MDKWVRNQNQPISSCSELPPFGPGYLLAFRTYIFKTALKNSAPALEFSHSNPVFCHSISTNRYPLKQTCSLVYIESWNREVV
jgi:hypothetical protein